MGADTKIEWATHTFNAWVGCAKVSEACRDCYAESWAKRTGHPELWRGERRRTTPANWRKPLKWNTETPGARVFCNSLADVFEDHPALVPWRSQLFDLILATPNLMWLLLTKRPENAVRLAPDWGTGSWPGNIWLGTTVENQATADERIPHLLRVPARVRFLSMEPLLGPVDLAYTCFTGADSYGTMPGIHWVITGGESGGRARPSHPDWFRSLRDQCARAGIPFLFKQHGELLAACQVTDDIQRWGPVEHPSPHNPEKTNTYYRAGKVLAGRLLDGVTHDGFPEVSRG